MNIFFTSDLHLDHHNIIQYTNRPFKTYKEMNEALIERWNSVVCIQDAIYCLGDLCMSKDSKRWEYFLNRLNGKIHLILGNHDKQKVINKVIDKFVWVKDYFFLKTQVNNKTKEIILMHYPMRTWNKSHFGSLHLHGHCHNGLKDPIKNSMDVGVDTNNYYPYSIETIIERFKNV